MKISKSDYILGLKCPLALWYKKHRPDLCSEFNDGILSQGNEVGLLAHKLYKDGKLVHHKPWEDAAIVQTGKFVEDGVTAIFEAVAKTETGEYCAADILKRNEDGSWNIIEVKSSTKVKEYHLIDLSFQYYVFTNAGYNIKSCYIVTVNNQYVRKGDIDPFEFFNYNEVTEDVVKLAKNLPQGLELVRDMQTAAEPACEIGGACSYFFDCQYIDHCWQNIPDYSVFDVMKMEKAVEIFRKYKTADLQKLPRELFLNERKSEEINCFLDERTIVEVDKIADFLAALEYPLYFLDYETICSAIPLFEGTSPYQQIPFQFSLHILNSPDSQLEHVEFLHEKQTDPREELIKKLITSCSTNGSIVVYNQGFEKTVNKKLAESFSVYAQELFEINNRVVDLIVPFRKRMLYNYEQYGSSSIKKTLPAFTDISYANLAINNGSDASSQYLDFLKGLVPESDDLFENLLEYCGQDTLAMVKLLDVLNEYSSKKLS
ncbi:MAG: DUF2779 domain-containing protein [Candidatus Gastranaerophilales bacterium]|nr:DUF2779 domain-containing protein [Candidatus Gastranaerophilales bacterium]